MTIQKPIAKHGTNYAYKKRGCRCFLCRDWQARRMRELRRKRKTVGMTVGANRRRRHRPRFLGRPIRTRQIPKGQEL